MKRISLQGIATRFAVAFGLVVLSWNPTPVNFYRWAANQWNDLTPIVFFVGLVLLIAWVIFLRATLRSLGAIGIGLAVTVAGSILWIVSDYGLGDPANGTVLGWVLLTLLSAVLAAGMSWSHLRRRWSGQADIDDVEDVGD